VLGAVLAGCFAAFYTNEGILELLEDFRTLEDPVGPAYARAWQESTLNRAVPEPFMEMVVEETRKPPVRVWDAALRGLIEDRPEPAGTITVPTLLCYGERDALVPRSDQDELLARIPGAELRVYEDGGHALHWERPERYAADLAEFAALRVPA
jgi:pimeloyl-ACP methyl ester carboxylesterase